MIRPNSVKQITHREFNQLHRGRIDEADAVKSLLIRVVKHRVAILGGINRRSDREVGLIQSIDGESLRLATSTASLAERTQIFLRFILEEEEYFFELRDPKQVNAGLLQAPLPEVIYCIERRGVDRMFAGSSRGREPRVELRSDQLKPIEAAVTDWSFGGLGIEYPAGDGEPPLGSLSVRFLTGPRAGEQAHAEVRHRRLNPQRPGWVKLGLSISQVNAASLIPVEVPIAGRRLARTRDQAALIGARLKLVAKRSLQRLRSTSSQLRSVPLVSFHNDEGEEIRAIIDRFGDEPGGTAVIIPPAWGRTKETLLPLALTIRETFRSAGEPVTIVRFDGIRRRGESYIDPEARIPGHENVRFTFSQGVRDIQATMNFLEKAPHLKCEKFVLVTFSAAAIEGRRVLAVAPRNRFAGWVSVVGMGDSQSALRTISGGLDYVYGLMRGVRFGLQEVLGVLVDIDHVGIDAIENRLVFLEDARQDMAAIKVPITWIHGKYDAWMDLEHVRHLMSCGDTSARRLVQVPTGHQLRTSREAFDTFRLVASEVARFALNRRVRAPMPDFSEIERRRSAERERLPRPLVDLRGFWADYLLGRDRRVGIELVTSTTAYQQLMECQAVALDLRPGQTVADLGSGLGSFVETILRSNCEDRHLRVVEVDCVKEALARTIDRLAGLGAAVGVDVRTAAANLDAASVLSFPFRSGSFDAVLASLVVSYLGSPSVFLEEVYRILKPGGRFVLSSMRRDGDISKIYLDGTREMRGGRAAEILGSDVARDFDVLARPFVNDAARILDFEELGLFRFWDSAELQNLIESAGFVTESVAHSLGAPPQAVILAARRPD